MLLHTGSLFRIYFGDAKDKLYPDEYLQYADSDLALGQESFTKLKKIMQLDDLVFLRQMHSAYGMEVLAENIKTIKSFRIEGDYIITQMQRVGIGVMTADCLPIILFDNFNKVVAVVHAGWKGSAQSVAAKAVEAMQQMYNTDLEQLRIFFGPSAKVCCYQVQPDFSKELEAFDFADELFRKNSEGQLYFDLTLFNKIQLERMGIKKEAFRLQYNICTVCDPSFFSYRRQGAKAGRQMTVVCLK